MIRSKADVWKAMLAITIFAVITSLVLTAIFVETMLGPNVEGAVSLQESWKVAMGIATVVPLVVAPVTSWGLATMVLKLQEARQELDRLARSDAMTGLLNRRGFEAAGTALLARAAEQRQPVGLILADIDHFKRVNDTAGHEAGDAVIMAVAACLARAAATRPDAIAGRLGGEEFAILVSGLPLRKLHALAESLRENVAEMAIPFGDCALTVTISLGLAVETHDGATLPALLRGADHALYRAKEGGRNRVELPGLAA